MIKVFFTNNKDNKISFTEEELQALLKEAHDEGYQEGYKEGTKAQTTIPSINSPSYTPDWYKYITTIATDGLRPPEMYYATTTDN